jgi:hypothetical protein
MVSCAYHPGPASYVLARLAVQPLGMSKLRIPARRSIDEEFPSHDDERQNAKGFDGRDDGDEKHRLIRQCDGLSETEGFAADG